jgi:hypothetical protein
MIDRVERAEQGGLSLREGDHLTAHVLYEGSRDSVLRCECWTACRFYNG